MDTLKAMPAAGVEGTSQIDTLACLFKDLTCFSTSRWAIHAESIKLRLKESCVPDEELDEFMRIAVEPFKETIDAVQLRIVQAIAQPCLELLGLMKNIPVQYRRTNKEAPTKSSYFIAQSLKPLEMFLDKHEFWLADEQKRAFAHCTLEQVMTE